MTSYNQPEISDYGPIVAEYRGNGVRRLSNTEGCRCCFVGGQLQDGSVVLLVWTIGEYERTALPADNADFEGWTDTGLRVVEMKIYVQEPWVTNGPKGDSEWGD